jgi:hypothetical protein
MNRTLRFFWTTALLTLSLSGILGAGPAADLPGGVAYNENDFDRLDGTGQSGLTVHVIEWEGNLELHSEPPGRLSGFSLKIDDRDAAKKVMVIGYRIAGQPRPLIRRAILSIPLSPKFNVYRDRSAKDYDKFVITNQGLSNAEFLAFKPDPAPTQLYPDEHPAVANTNRGASGRQPASAAPELRPSGSPDSNRSGESDDDGTIRGFGAH